VTPDLSVVVVSHNGRDVALETLRSAHASSGPIDVEWFVVDSGSSDGTPDAIEAEFPDVTLLRHGNIGFAAGNNVALPRASGRYVLLLNPDVSIQKGTFAGLVAALDAQPDVGAASVVQLHADGSLQRSIRRYPSARRALAEALFAHHTPLGRRLGEVEERDSEYRRDRDADWLVGAFLIMRREAATAVGLLDERFFLYSEETDLCRRIRDLGWRLRHLTVMEVTHYGSGSYRPQLAAQLSHSKALYGEKHLGRAGSAAQRGALALGHAVRLVGARARVRRRPELRDRVDAERMALRVVLKQSPPPFAPEAEPTTREPLPR
jgi:N-acetylglucosaminyl-diphospho-decaprenol L-rhamnosyltransferase